MQRTIHRSIGEENQRKRSTFLKKKLKTSFWNIGVINLAKLFSIHRPLYTLKANNFHKLFTKTDQANVESQSGKFFPGTFNNVSIKSNMTLKNHT